MWGKIYFWCMAVVGFTALVMAIYRPTLFLALVAVFSFYSAFIGYRVLGQKAAWKGKSVAKPLDWIAAILCFAASAGLALLGAFRPALVSHLGIPAIVFGTIGMLLSGGAMWDFTHPPKEKMFWWYAHLQGMIGSYIAAWTAFCVVTIGPLLHGAWWIMLQPSAFRRSSRRRPTTSGSLLRNQKQSRHSAQHSKQGRHPSRVPSRFVTELIT